MQLLSPYAAPMQNERQWRFRGAFPKLVVLDFDGVLTDNGVWVNEDGTESVRCDRSDGLGLAMLREAGVAVLVLSTEQNRVVAARCKKLQLAVEYGVRNKGARLSEILRERGTDPSQVIYLGNDVNDIGCMQLVGTAVVVADAHPQVAGLADVVLSRTGGHGAVRELCDDLLQHAQAAGWKGDPEVAG
jgi:YrbI family 3-deoxy-D-manno-octulosonate 8-phosphate phosphatase